MKKGKHRPCNFIKKETLTQVFSCEFCEISKNTFFTEHLWTNASIISVTQFSSVWTTFYLNLVNTTLLHLNIKQFFKIMQTYVNYVIISCKLCLKCDNFLCVTACLDLTNRGTMYISQNSFSNLHDFPSDESTNNFCKIKVNAT